MIAIGMRPEDYQDGRDDCRWGQLLSCLCIWMMFGARIQTLTFAKTDVKRMQAYMELLETYECYRSERMNFPPKAKRFERALQLEIAGCPRELVDAQLIQEHGIDPDLGSESTTFTFRVHGTCFKRSFFRTVHDTVGIGHSTVKEGDEVWLLAGSAMPVIVRPAAGNLYNLIGEAYVDGAMFGEKWPKSTDDLLPIILA